MEVRAMLLLALGSSVRAKVLLIALLPLMGCYTYAETSMESLTSGTRVRLLLDQDGFGRVVNQAALNGVPSHYLNIGERGVSGRILQLGPQNLSIELRGAGASVFAADIPTPAVQEVGLRQLDRRRTIGAVAGLGALGYLILKTGVVGGTTSPEQPPEIPNMAPLISIPIRFR